MAHIIKRKNREGKYYVYLVESFRDGDQVKKRTLKAYGPLDELEKKEPGAFDRLRREAKAGLLHEDIPKHLTVTYDLEQEISNDLLYGWKILEELFYTLEIPQVFKSALPNIKKRKRSQKVLELLVYQRLLDPGSKFYTLNTPEELFGNWDLTKNSLYRSLAPLSKIKEEIQQRVTKALERTETMELYKIEDCFKVTKAFFKARPVHLRLEDHIEAHFLSCFLGLVFLRIIQNKINWQLSPCQLIKALKSARAHKLSTGFYRVQANDDLKFLLAILGIQWDKAIVKDEQLTKFAHGWSTT